jgi:hypothetical protein
VSYSSEEVTEGLKRARVGGSASAKNPVSLFLK